jgi:hypothetical protein
MRRTTTSLIAGTAAALLTAGMVLAGGTAGAATGGGDALGPGPCALEPTPQGVPDDLSGDGHHGIDGNADGRALVRIDLATGDHLEVAPGSSGWDARAAIDGDGDRIAFSSDQDLTGGNPEGGLEVFLADLTADTVQQLTDLDGLDVGDVQISGDGQHVAFEAGDTAPSETDGRGSLAAYHVDVAAGSVEQVSADGERIISIDLAVGGGHLVYSLVDEYEEGQGSAAGYLVDLASDARQPIPVDWVRDPQVSADGSVVAVFSPRGGAGGGWDAVLVWDVAGSAVTNVVDTIPGGPQRSSVVELSADGSSLLFFGPNATLSRVDVAGGGATLFGESYGRWNRTGVGSVQASDDLRTVLLMAAVGPAGGPPDQIPAMRPVRAHCDAEVFSDDAGVTATWARWSGLSAGYADGTFRSEDPISRQAMAAMLHRFAGSPTLAAGSAGFPDVGAGNPFRAEIRWAHQEGLMYGYPDGTFRPVNPVSNQALASLAYRAAGEPDVSAHVDAMVEQLQDVGPGNDHVEGITWWVRSFDDPYYPVQTIFEPLEPASRGVTVWALFQVAFIADR